VQFAAAAAAAAAAAKCASTRFMFTRNSSGDENEIASVNFFNDDIFNHVYALRSGSYRIR